MKIAPTSNTNYWSSDDNPTSVLLDERLSKQFRSSAINPPSTIVSGQKFRASSVSPRTTGVSDQTIHLERRSPFLYNIYGCFTAS